MAPLPDRISLRFFARYSPCLTAKTPDLGLSFNGEIQSPNAKQSLDEVSKYSLTDIKPFESFLSFSFFMN